MKTSQRGLEDIIYSEGEKLTAYSDTLTRPDGSKYKDVPTIGVGHTSAAGPPGVTMGMTITHDESRAILAADLVKVEDRVAKAFGKDVSQNVFDGAVSFDFNTGGILSASWVRSYLIGAKSDAEDRLLQWNKPPEIIGRRKREADLIFRGKYHSPGTIDPPFALPPEPAAADQLAAMKAVQGKLAGAGFDPGPIDGLLGDRTKAALQGWALKQLR